ncbi:MAG: NAD(P)/FAD-dependent oxidoreductase [Candidatus Thorarchaeota archaeon]|nr:NAD(P)/FAD-dependent oxidoreductase [Candidatus Thorarchaeota archaeon]
MYDLVVVGSGPAGSTCARKASLAGLDTAIVEKEEHPREKICGGAIGPRVKRELGFSIDAIAERKFYSASICGPEGVNAELNLQKGTGYIVRRSRFDSYLLERAREAGTDVFEDSKTVACEQLRSGVRVLCEGDSFKARLIAGADGFESVVARSMKIRDCWQPDEVAIGFATNVPLEEAIIEDASYKDSNGQLGLEIYLGAINWGYGWLFPRRDEVNIGLGCRSDKADNLRAEWEAFLQKLKRSKRAALEKSNYEGFRLPFYTRSAKLVSRRTMLLGDAAGLASPITGEGIYYAIRSGTIAAEVAKETVDMKQAAHVISYENRISEELGKELEVQRFIAKTLFQSGERISRLIRLLSEDKVLRGYAKQIVLGKSSEYLKRKIIQRMITMHPLEAIRFSI